MSKKAKDMTELDFLRYLLAIELWRGGLSQAEIAKRIGVATGSVNALLKGVSRELNITPVKE
ncbi:hypothetical protein EHQ05_19300 [Leptospira yasudae]|uniref:hypothetical protein n=1 Tax=Leptospira yasudae TaxID=2202201 RepID=UPI001082C909|nr:hypothetical protein [Leptospira yasudae]TGK23332.1 hypothetical protein EHQ05_19300 [Leptospira yasudae]TGM09809.1 hypothetical protein EHQ86_00120 [Leptospira yasudae]